MPKEPEVEIISKVVRYGEPPQVAGKYLLDYTSKKWQGSHKKVEPGSSELVYERDVRFCKELFVSWDLD